MTPAMLPAQGGQRDGPRQSDPPALGPQATPPGGWLTGRPSPPPRPARLARRRKAAPGARGCPTTPTERVHLGGMRRRRREDCAEGRRPPPPEREEGSHGATPPLSPHPPHRPASQGGAGPRPPEAEEVIPPPPGTTAAPGRKAGAGPAPTPQPPAPTGTTMDKRTRANTPGRNTDRARRQQASTNRRGMGATRSMARATPRTPALLPAQGRQRDRPRQGDPPPHWPPRPHSRGERRTGRPPTPCPGAGTPQTRRPTPQGAHSPKPGRGETGPPPPPKNKPNGAQDRGTTRGGARTAWNGPTSTQHRDRARCARHTNQGRGGGDAAGPRAHTHTKDTRGLPEGQPDRARGTHRPHGIAYQRARVRDTRTGRPATHSGGRAGREGGNGEDTTPGTGPSPPKRARAPRTHNQGTAPAKAVVAHRATHQPQG